MVEVMLDAEKKKPSKTYIDATPLLDDVDSLRKQADQDGYLFFKNFYNVDAIMEVRKQIASILDKHGLLNKDFPTLDGVVDLKSIHEKLTLEDVNWNGVGVPEYIYKEVQKLEVFHALAHDQKILTLFQTLFGEPAFPHPRHIARIMLPHRQLITTPSHQDFLHIQGAEKTWTCWMPLGDAPEKMGSLSMLEGSHKAGLLGIVKAPGAGGLESILCGLGYEWVSGDFTIGDMITFHSHTVHRGMPNQIKNRIRISADMRFQPINAPIESRSLLPHGPFEWDDIYMGWKNEKLKYYWNDLNLSISTFDVEIRWQKDKIC